MRTFISLNLSNEAVEEIKRVQKELLRSGLYNGKITEEENLHLTLKFLGELNEKQVEEVRRRLKEIKIRKFKAQLREIGVFSKEFVRIVWIKLEGVDELQRQVDKALHGLFTHEKRFMGHMTIARVKSIKDKTKFYGLLKRINVKEIEFEVVSFQINESKLYSKGPEYRVIEEFGLS